MEKQLIYIGGGESFETQAEFIERLHTRPLKHLPEESTISITKSWKDSLQENLGEEWRVIIPPMPNRQNAQYEEWSIWFERHFKYLHDGAVLVGCSLGAMFLAKYLASNNLPFKPGAVMLLAGSFFVEGSDVVGSGSFLIKPEAAADISKKYKTVIMHSKDDFVVPYEHGVALAEALPDAEFITFEDKNHFLIEEFPELVEEIRKLG